MNNVHVDQWKDLLKAAGKRPKGKARGEHTPGSMNRTEAEFAATVLEPRKLVGEIINYEFEAVTLKLAPDCRLTPDFMIEYPDKSLEFIDVKGAGPVQEDSVIKMRLAARLFPRWCFAMERKRKKCDGGGFERKEFKAA